MQKKVIYQTQWVARDKEKEYPHGWGFTPPLVEFPQDWDPAVCIRECAVLSDPEFECIGATAVPAIAMFPKVKESWPRPVSGANAENPTKEIPPRSEYDKCTSTKHNSVCLARAGDDEPIFVLRAKDTTAPEIVEEWCARNNDLQPIEKVGGAMLLADKMREWYNENIKA